MLRTHAHAIIHTHTHDLAVIQVEQDAILAVSLSVTVVSPLFLPTDCKTLQLWLHRTRLMGNITK